MKGAFIVRFQYAPCLQHLEVAVHAISLGMLWILSDWLFRLRVSAVSILHKLSFCNTLAQVVRLGLHHRNLKTLVIDAAGNRDALLDRLFPEPFSVPHRVLQRPWGKDLQVTFSQQ